MAERCQAIARRGKPCGATVVAEGMCAWHAPSWDAKRRQWSARGGASRRNQARARRQFAEGALSPADIDGLLGTTMKAVLSGKVTPGQGQAVAALARAAMAVREVSTLEERVVELEALARRGWAS